MEACVAGGSPSSGRRAEAGRDVAACRRRAALESFRLLSAAYYDALEIFHCCFSQAIALVVYAMCCAEFFELQSELRAAVCPNVGGSAEVVEPVLKVLSYSPYV